MEKESEKTQSIIVALKAARAYVKEAETLEDAVAKIDELLLIANTAKDVEKAETRKAIAEVMGGELIEVKLELFSPFVDFLKEYLRFFGAKKTLEDLCREMIYEQAEYVFRELYDFVSDKGHFLATKDWYWKFPHMSTVSVKDEEPEENC